MNFNRIRLWLLILLLGGLMTVLLRRQEQQAPAEEPVPTPREADRSASRPGTRARRSRPIPRDYSSQEPDNASKPTEEEAVDKAKLPKGAIPDERIFGFYDEADRRAFVKIARELGFEVLDEWSFGNSVRLRIPAGASLAELLQRAPHPINESFNFYARYPNLPFDPDADPELAAGPRFGQRSLDWLGVPRDNATWGSGVRVAVLDTGIQAHPSLDGSRVQTMSLLDATGEPVDPSARAHGTAVASIIAGDGDGVRGVAPAANLLGIEVLGAEGLGNGFTLAQGIVAAVDAGAQVINLSLGTYGSSFILEQAVDYALAQGVVLVAATGNDQSNYVLYPAAYNGVLAVTAVDAAGNRISVANTGEQVDLAAPGMGVTAAGAENNQVIMSGTSAAAPFVSGAIAALMASDPRMDAAQAIEILLSYGNDRGAPGVDPEYGNGILDMGRVANRDQSGIIDIAIAPPYLPPNQDPPNVVLYVQNRGTEPLHVVNMPVTIDGVPIVATFYDVAVGETRARSFPLEPTHLAAGSVTITYGADIPNQTDRYPRNNPTATVNVGLAPPGE